MRHPDPPTVRCPTAITTTFATRTWQGLAFEINNNSLCYLGILQTTGMIVKVIFREKPSSLPPHISLPRIAPTALLLNLSADTHISPCLTNNLGSIFTKLIFSAVNSHICKLLEWTSIRDVSTRHRLPPDLSRPFPRKIAKCCGCKVECLVGNARVDVNSAVVVPGSLVPRHIVYLRIPSLQESIEESVKWNYGFTWLKKIGHTNRGSS